MIRALSSRCYTIYHHQQTHTHAIKSCFFNQHQWSLRQQHHFSTQKEVNLRQTENNTEKIHGRVGNTSQLEERRLHECVRLYKRTRTPYRPTSNLAHWKCASPLRALHLSARAHRLSRCTHARMRVMLTQESSVPLLVTPPKQKSHPTVVPFLCKSHPSPIPQLPQHQWNVENKGPTMKF